jgi:hypothetical protein
VGTPYEGLGAALDNNDGLIVIEASDYQGGNTNLVIVGAQIAGSDEGITGTGTNLNGAVDSDTVDGSSSGTQAFSTDTSDAPFKISSIGFLTTSTEDQSASIDFDVTIHDADGDTATQHITVNIGDTQSPALLPTDPQAFSAISTESLLASDSQEQQVQKAAANSNTLTLAAAVAAAGMAESAAAAGNSDFGRSHNNGETEFAHGNFGRVAGSGSGDDSGQAAISAAQSSDVPAAANDQAPAPAEASPVAMSVGMPSAEALQAAGVADDAKQDGSVEQVVADALGQGNAPAAVDALLDALPGGNGALAALAHVASPAAGDVSAWDMAASGAFGHAADMVMNVHAMQHHDAVQPVVNG